VRGREWKREEEEGGEEESGEEESGEEESGEEESGEEEGGKEEGGKEEGGKEEGGKEVENERGKDWLTILIDLAMDNWLYLHHSIIADGLLHDWGTKSRG